MLEQALEDHVLLTIWIVRGLLRTAWSQRILILDYLEETQVLRMLFLHNLIYDAPFREASQLRLPEILQETVGLEKDDAVQASLLPLKNLHPILNKLLNLLLLLFDLEVVLVELELFVLFFNLIDNFFGNRESTRAVARVLRML